MNRIDIRKVFTLELRLSLINIFYFFCFILLLYKIFPIFLIQNHDGQNSYYLIDKIIYWKLSFFDFSTFIPLQATGSSSWPINPLLIPFAWPFQFTQNIEYRILGIQIVQSLLLFLCTFLFYLSASVRVKYAILASWLSFFIVMLQEVGSMTGFDVLIALDFTYLFLACYLQVGRHGYLPNFIYAILSLLTYCLTVLAHPGWHMIGLPVLIYLTTVFTLTSRGLKEIGLKLATLLLILICILFFEPYKYYALITADTARYQTYEIFEKYQQIPYLAGHLFRNSPFEFFWGIFLLVGIFFGNNKSLFNDLKRKQYFIKSQILLLSLSSLIGILFLYWFKSWELPKPSYIFLFSYPLEAFFVVLGIFSLNEIRDAPITKKITFYLCILIFIAWQLINQHIFPWYWIFLFISLIAIVVSFKFKKIAIIIFLPLLICEFYLNGMELGNGLSSERNFERRIGISKTQITEYLTSKLSVNPGSTFNGYLDDYYSGYIGNDIIKNATWAWNKNLGELGNGYKLFNWSSLDIPIISSYSPYIPSLYFKFYTFFLNNKNDIFTVNYLSTTKINLKIMSLLGVRYVLSDIADISVSGLDKIFSSNGFYIYEILNPNIGNYSPVDAINSDSFIETVKAIDSDSFNPRVSFITPNNLEKIKLTPVRKSTLLIEKGGFRVLATGGENSVLIIPIWFSNCMTQIQPTGSNDPKIFRANIIQTGILFHGSIDAKFRLKTWPFNNLECKIKDLSESKFLLSR